MELNGIKKEIIFYNVIVNLKMQRLSHEHVPKITYYTNFQKKDIHNIDSIYSVFI